MGTKVFLTAVRVASVPTFIPGATPEGNHAIVTVMSNRKGRDGKDYSDDFTVHMWNKGAAIAANYLSVGKRVNIEGRLQSYTQDTGQTNGAGKKILNRKTEIVCQRLELLDDSMKVTQAIFDANIAAMKATGRLDSNAQINLVELIPKKAAMVDFNPQLAAQTGKYGHANVWSKDKGHWNANRGTNAVVNAPPATDKIAELQAQVDQLRNASVANAAGGAGNGPTPF